MDRYARKTLATEPDGRRVLVSTVAHGLLKETAVFPANDAAEVTSALQLYRRKLGVEEDPDAAHDAIVTGVQDSTLTLTGDRESTPEEVEEAWGELISLAKMTDNRAMDDETNNA
jgi:hypothetical protein